MSIKLALALVLSGAAAQSYASEGSVPCRPPERHCLPQTAPDPEKVTVTDQRIPGYLIATEDSLELKAQRFGSVPGAVANPADVNANGESKADKAKEDEAAGNSTWWMSLIKQAQVIGKRLSSWNLTTNGSVSETTKPDGTKTTELKWCLDVAKGTRNTTNCTKTEMYKRQDGTFFVAFHKLVVMPNARGVDTLVYSTDDTIGFIVHDEAELYSLLGIQPE